MKRLFLPILLLFIGIGGGVAAGLFVAPATETPAPYPNACGVADDHDAGSETDPHGDELLPETGDDHAADASEDGHALGGGHEYVRLNNQFVVPIVEGSAVSALVLLSISVEVPSGEQEAVLLVEPKLRDAFLQVLFDHANTGGFEGMFTATDNMRTLRRALLRAAQDSLGPTITDVLIVDIVRQDV